MKIRAQYFNYQIVLDIVEGHSVYDGFSFVDPDQAEYIQLFSKDKKTFSPVSYPLFDAQPQLENNYLCKVLEIVEASVDYADLISEPSFPCLCGTTRLGAEVLTVPVVIV
jgi:hypothetical protein